MKEVRASLEGFWDSLINDKFFISLTKGLASVLGSVEKLVDGMGGLRGVIVMIGGLFAKHIVTAGISGIQNLTSRIGYFQK
jgi:hypothetical protein